MIPSLIVRDMTTTRPEFFRCLKSALCDNSSTIEGNHIRVIDHDREINMRLSSLPARVLSQTLKLERWELIIEFNGQSEDQRKAFMKKFDQAFHRGGG